MDNYTHKTLKIIINNLFLINLKIFNNKCIIIKILLHIYKVLDVLIIRNNNTIYTSSSWIDRIARIRIEIINIPIDKRVINSLQII